MAPCTITGRVCDAASSPNTHFRRAQARLHFSIKLGTVFNIWTVTSRRRKPKFHARCLGFRSSPFLSRRVELTPSFSDVHASYAPEAFPFRPLHTGPHLLSRSPDERHPTRPINTVIKHWDLELEKTTKEMRTPSLTMCIIRCYWRPYAVLGFFTLVEEVIKVIQPLILGKMIEYFESYDPLNMTALYETLGYATAMSLCTIGLALLHHLYFYHVQRTGMKIRVAMCHMIYRKVSRWVGAARACFLEEEMEMGVWLQPVVDALRLSSAAMGKTTTGQIVNLLSNDVNKFDDAAVVVGLLWLEIGPSCLAGMVVLMVLMPTQIMFGRLFSKFSKIILFVTFTLYVLLGNTITASRVFVTVSLYSAVRLTITLFFPSAIEKLYETRVSIRRIQEFLMLDEIVRSKAEPPLVGKMDAAVVIRDLVCYWDKSLDAPSLQNLSLTLNSNQLLAVIGPVGAGKSSLLSTILGELPAERGVLEVKGQLTYAAQQPWVFPGTIRSNILFGKPLEPHKYERVLRACALKRISAGERSCENLHYSGEETGSGFRRRMESFFLLTTRCICGLLKNKLRILVTHQLQYLKSADQIVVLKEGHMVAKGKYAELQRSGVDFTSLLKEEEEPPGDALMRTRTLSENSVRSHTSSLHSVKDGDQLPAETVQTVAEESRAQGNIGVALYLKYLKAGASVAVLLAVIAMNILAQVPRPEETRRGDEGRVGGDEENRSLSFVLQLAYILQDWWLAHWYVDAGDSAARSP
ncbi:Multidrug resistance-associated protein 4 [Liparis tanakae]|uniref:Multidrug resistance-associated protein 4 n=1 Tax=Liparis tanakae TaxID=230148 RepID=A0A4Z2H8Y5_9TELE|nr:Multidrug resistance-associated protein 4 [Liparis tanakae]